MLLACCALGFHTAHKECFATQDIASGTPRTPSDKELQLPTEVVQQLRDVVFGFDTFYVTSVENYQANGVLFKGNLRGRSPAESYKRTAARLKVRSLTYSRNDS